MIVSVTRLRLRSVRYLLPFFWQVVKVYWQVKSSSGNRGIKITKTEGLAFWTCTLWQDQEALLAFSGTGRHEGGKPKLQIWCDEAAHGHWQSESPALPNWREAATGLLECGRLNDLDYPSAKQRAGEFNLS